MIIPNVWLILYVIFGIGFTELISTCANTMFGRYFTWIEKLFFFTFWPLILLSAIIAAITQKK